MKLAEDGFPVVGQSARDLGARPGVDIPIDIHGNVSPRTGGMSVTADNVLHLPAHRRPAEFNGIGKDPVFAIRTEHLPGPLVARQDGPPHHFLIEPRIACSFSKYQQDLHASRPWWAKL